LQQPPHGTNWRAYCCIAVSDGQNEAALKCFWGSLLGKLLNWRGETKETPAC
jgi:hypothetical protein